ncbi:hypothetical protein I316_01964 [Kwoniella heveanensis BCC8398]|uniref:J domain-containing protein n=1 Tax=Kwoniella heveanensis BCC8398 TaxID=1296120 RepID=A0A1B9GYL7_9TREE|nr:hypothetical protein I316_01964 [Kwoniella heveanensis BCC8398]
MKDGGKIIERFDMVKQWFPGMQDLEAHILPFWTLALVCDQVVTQVFQQSGGTYYEEMPKRIQSEIGLTIAAVPPNHWASGYIIPYTVRHLSMGLEQLLKYSKHLPPEQSWMPSDTPRIYSNRNDRCDPFVNPEWNPSIAPKFALSPPRLTEREVERIITLQANDIFPWDEIWNPKGIKLFAVPSYSLIYKVSLRSGLGIMDAQSPVIGNNTLRINWLPGGTRGTDEYLWQKIGFQTRPRQPDGRFGIGEPERCAFQPNTKISTLFSTVHEAMKRRGPMTREMWEDPRIFPDFGPATEGNCQTLDNWIQDHVSGYDKLPEPRYPLRHNQRSSGASSSIFASRIKPKTGAARPANAEDAASHSPSSTQAPPKEERTTGRFGVSAADKRRAYIRNRAKLAGDAVLRSTFLDKGSALSRYPTVLPDPKGHYRRLGIYEPGREFLEVKTREMADKKISEQYIAYSLETHPDRPGGSDAEFIPVKEANVALETLEKRLAYYKRSS